MMEGKKTYVVAALMAAASIASAFGIDIPGYPVDPQWGVHLLQALGIAALRSGVAKVGNQ